jgi:hypothetical protein
VSENAAVLGVPAVLQFIARRVAPACSGAWVDVAAGGQGMVGFPHLGTVARPRRCGRIRACRRNRVWEPPGSDNPRRGTDYVENCKQRRGDAPRSARRGSIAGSRIACAPTA